MVNRIEAVLKKLNIPVVKFIIPFTIWGLFFRKILLGQSPPLGDGLDHYFYTHYFISNLRIGVFPLWNPFISLGMPQLFFNSLIGAFNPLWTFMLLLNLIGVNIYFSYVYSVVLYFFLGTLGFYYLAKLYFQKIQYAYPAFILFLFSGFGFPMLHDLKVLIVFVPMIWFFYFCLLFQKTKKPFSFIGMTFALMIGATSYFPPYWIATLVIVFFFIMIFFSKSFFLFIKNLWTFLKYHKTIFLICFFSIMVSSAISLKAYTIARNDEVVFAHRKRSLALADIGPSVGLHKVKGLMITMEQFQDDFLNIGPGRFSAPTPVTFYLSPFVFILILLGCFNKITKAILVKFLFCLILFLMTAVPNSFVVDFFFHFLWGFNLIQATGLFLPALMMGMIFLAITQGKKIVEEKFFLEKKIGFVLVTLIHLVFIFYFLFLSNISFFSYGSVVSSLLFFFFLFLKNKKTIIITLLLYIAILLQPWEVIKRYTQNLYPGSREIFQAIAHEPAQPIFSYIRPKINIPEFRLPREHLWHDDILMRDAPAVITRDFPPRWTYALFQSGYIQGIPSPSVEKYSLNKFYLYDGVYITDQEKFDTIEKIFEKQKNTAIVHLDSIKPSNPSFLALKNILLPEIKVNETAAEVIVGPREDFRVVDFNANSLKIQTNFKRDRFLVYTNSYQSDWIALINGEKKEIFRSNIAFKGIFIPKGFNEIILVYAPLGGQKTYFLVLALYNGILLWLIILILKERTKKQKHPEIFLTKSNENF